MTDFFNGLIIGFLVIQLIVIIVATVHHKQIPLTAHILGVIVIILGVASAIVRESLWPLGTIFMQILMLVVLIKLDHIWEKRAIYEKDMAIKKELDEEEWRSSHINRELEEGKKG